MLQQGTSLHFRGFANLNAVLDSLNTTLGLYTANEVILSGRHTKLHVRVYCCPFGGAMQEALQEGWPCSITLIMSVAC